MTQMMGKTRVAECGGPVRVLVREERWGTQTQGGIGEETMKVGKKVG